MNQPQQPESPEPESAQEELDLKHWQAHDAHAASAGLLHKLSRLPALTASALRWAWTASPRDLVTALVCSALAATLAAVSLASVTRVLDALLAEGTLPERLSAALVPLLVVAGVAALGGLSQLGSDLSQARLRPQIERLVEVRLFDLTTQVELEAFDDSDWNDAMYRARDRGMYEVAGMVMHTLEVLGGLVGLISLAGVLAVLHPALVPLLALTVVPVAWAAVRAARMEYQARRRLSTSRRRRWILGDRMASRDSAEELRAFTMRDFLLSTYTRLADRERAAMLEVAWRQLKTRAAGQAAGGLATAVTFAALGGLLLAEAMPLAAAGTAVLAIQQARGRMQTLVYAINSTYESGLYFTDYNEFCNQAGDRVPPAATAPAPGPLTTLSLEKVTFTYPTADQPSLREVSLSLQRGEIIALVGANGSGKTTLARLLAGLYRPQHGTVRWNGTDLADHGTAASQHISMIIQDHTRWPLSAETNVVMSEHADPDRRDHAAALSGADEVVATLARGWKTTLDPAFAGGVDPSGGQWQRIAGARGLYRQGHLLIADEPTAALDAHAEARAFETIRAQAHATGAAVVLITHRMSSVRMADHVFVLDQGCVVEDGTHTQLLDHGGLYADMYTTQARSYQDPPLSSTGTIDTGAGDRTPPTPSNTESH